ncbi:hypothetical protein NC99_10930 [Sunxiuqinia dokdonensis]|uniref:Uncharacterized protein n=1 Tax=Sunxiuqinia dokdonensis TaxID=1409788 RepID=A0A0L8VCG8_9BACT|nr:hypothetical protein NC99_10930 [Sunxiuqinia dokdonensis]
MITNLGKNRDFRKEPPVKFISPGPRVWYPANHFYSFLKLLTKLKTPCQTIQTTFIRLLIKKFDIILYQFVCLCNFIS